MASEYNRAREVRKREMSLDVMGTRVFQSLRITG